jgi:lambda family phage portal protein
MMTEAKRERAVPLIRRALGVIRGAIGGLDVRLRAYEGASRGKRLEGWNTTNGSPRAEVEKAAPTLRARSRDLARNNPYATRAVTSVVANTVGHGILARTKKKRVQEKWKAWASSTKADFRGENTFYALQALVLRTVVESGEVLVRRVVEKGKFKLQVLEPEFLDEIIEDEAGRPVAYKLFRKHPSEDHSEALRVPAEDIIHLYRIDRPGQARGVPWLAPVILTARSLDEYQDAEIMRRKVASCMAGFVSFPHDTDEATKDEISLTRTIRPGTFTELPDGAAVHFSTPPSVQGYAEFVQSHLRGMAVGTGVTYEGLTGDYSQVNFSSGRMGWIEMQRLVDQWRWFLLIPRFCDRVWEWFCEVNFLGEEAVEWTPPRREMLDPVKETTGMKLAVEAGFTTVSEVIRSQGDDPDAVFEEREAEQKRLKRAGIVLDSLKRLHGKG